MLFFQVEYELETDPKNPGKKVAVNVTGLDGVDCAPKTKGGKGRGKGGRFWGGTVLHARCTGHCGRRTCGDQGSYHYITCRSSGKGKRKGKGSYEDEE